MNQVTNRIPYGLLTEEEKASFNYQEYSYKSYKHPMWVNCIFVDMGPRDDTVYRLVIQPEKWYCCSFPNISIADIKLGKDISIDYDGIRPATAEEIPKPTQEEKIADWLDCNIWDGDTASKGGCEKHKAFFSPQSLYELVTECLEDVK